MSFDANGSMDAVCKLSLEYGCKFAVWVYDAAHHAVTQRWGYGAHQIVADIDKTSPGGDELVFYKGEFMGLPERNEENASQAVNNPQQEQEDERRKLRRLQIMMNMVLSVISQDPELTVEEAAELAANAKRAALAMFPDKEFAYDILYKPRLQRVIAERFRVQ